MKLLTRWRTAAALRALSRHPHAVSRAMGAALGAAARHEVSVEERTAIDRIEALRQHLLASSERLKFYYEGGEVSERVVGDIARSTSQPQREALALFKIIRALRPRICVEMGTSLGMSAAYQASALELNAHGRLVTLEGAPEVAQLAAGHLRSLGLGRFAVSIGRFQETLPTVLKEHAPVEYVFVDGHHDEQATLQYTEQILPYAAPSSVLIYDDINWSAGMVRAWKALEADPRFALTIDAGKLGIAVVDAARQSPKQRLWVRLT